MTIQTAVNNVTSSSTCYWRLQTLTLTLRISGLLLTYLFQIVQCGGVMIRWS